MFTLRHNIILDHKIQLRNVVSVVITKDIHALSDTAIITLPAMHKNRTLEAEKLFTIGKPIRISLGYDERLEAEWEGYVDRLETRKDTLRVHCMDAMYFFRRQIPAKSYAETSLKVVLQELVDEVNQVLPSRDKISISIEKSLANISYIQYARHKGSAWDVFKKLKEGLPVFTYMRGHTLYVQPPFSFDEKTQDKKVRYDFSKNVTKSALRYKTAAHQPLQVTFHSREIIEDKPIQVSVGEAGGEVLSVRNYNIVHTDTLKELAKQELHKWQYDGYEGYIETFLRPYCTYGYAAVIQDTSYPERIGTFFVEKVTISFSSAGGRREIYLSKKLSTN